MNKKENPRSILVVVVQWRHYVNVPFKTELTVHHKWLLFSVTAAHVDKNYDVRLVGSKSSYQGRVEVFRVGYWGTVCSDGWDKRDAKVVCRQLGYAGAMNVFPSFAPGKGQIWLDDIRCIGNETNLDMCGHNGWSKHDCNHSKDATAVCDICTYIECYTMEYHTRYLYSIYVYAWAFPVRYGRISSAIPWNITHVTCILYMYTREPSQWYMYVYRVLYHGISHTLLVFYICIRASLPSDICTYIECYTMEYHTRYLYSIYVWFANYYYNSSYIALNHTYIITRMNGLPVQWIFLNICLIKKWSLRSDLSYLK
jgi:hypothetical protein